MDRDMAIVQLHSKNMILGLVLTFFLGGLGMFYIGIFWGLIGLSIEIILVIAVIFLGLASLGTLLPVLLPILSAFHILCLIVTAVVINSHNKRLLLDSLRQY